MEIESVAYEVFCTFFEEQPCLHLGQVAKSGYAQNMLESEWRRETNEWASIEETQDVKNCFEKGRYWKTFEGGVGWIPAISSHLQCRAGDLVLVDGLYNVWREWQDDSLHHDVCTIEETAGLEGFSQDILKPTTRMNVLFPDVLFSMRFQILERVTGCRTGRWTVRIILGIGEGCVGAEGHIHEIHQAEW